MDIAGIIAWITGNWDELLKLVLQVIGIASVIVRFTPTLKDDDVLKGVVRFLGKYVALNTNKGTGSPNS